MFFNLADFYYKKFNIFFFFFKKMFDKFIYNDNNLFL